MITFARKYHKWLMVFVGLQFLFWSVSGMYMVTMDIHHIHGEPLLKNTDEVLDFNKVNYAIADLLESYPQAQNIGVVNRLGNAIYRFNQPTADNNSQEHIVLDADTGSRLAKVDKTQALAIASYYYAGSEKVASVKRLTKGDVIPSELSARHLPVWQISFEHFSQPTFYISEQTGEIVTKRHHYWRLFDWMWRFHIMDYDDGENIANPLLLVVSLLALLAAIAGAVLTYYRVLQPQKEAR